MTRHLQSGLTLIELVTSIVVIGIAGSAVLGVLGYLSSSSGATVARTRAQDIAQLYLAEVLSRPFADPDGTPTEPTRAQFDDINDYAGLDDASARDQSGTVIAPWRVRVSVTAAALGSVSATNARRVDVRVDLPDGQSVLATGFRTRYP
ncbi:MAG: prepilin-type N-terminal cleavage/methylation domain-containing protein [Steroidobacteraceae bacterium]